MCVISLCVALLRHQGWELLPALSQAGGHAACLTKRVTPWGPHSPAKLTAEWAPSVPSRGAAGTEGRQMGLASSGQGPHRPTKNRKQMGGFQDLGPIQQKSVWDELCGLKGVTVARRRSGLSPQPPLVLPTYLEGLRSQP